MKVRGTRASDILFSLSIRREACTARSWDPLVVQVVAHPTFALAHVIVRQIGEDSEGRGRWKRAFVL